MPIQYKAAILSRLLKTPRKKMKSEKKLLQCRVKGSRLVQITSEHFIHQINKYLQPSLKPNLLPEETFANLLLGESLTVECFSVG